MHRDDSDQPAHLPSLIRFFHCALNRKLRTQCFFMRTTKADAQAGHTGHFFVCVLLFFLSCCGSDCIGLCTVYIHKLVLSITEVTFYYH